MPDSATFVDENIAMIVALFINAMNAVSKVAMSVKTMTEYTIVTIAKSPFAETVELVPTFVTNACSAKPVKKANTVPSLLRLNES